MTEAVAHDDEALPPCPPDHYTVHVRRKIKAGPVSREAALARVAAQNAGTPVYLGCTDRWWVFACPNCC